MKGADNAHVHLLSGGDRTLCCGRKIAGARYTDRPESVTCPVGLNEALENVRTAVPGSADYTHPDLLRETPRYTLDEARPIILGELCAKEGGHELETVIVSTVSGVARTMVVRCTRCGATFSEDPR